MMEIWQKIIYPALSSPATTALVAIIAATGAFIVYFMRRRDHKKDAANIILLEVMNAERNLEEARKSYEDGRQKNTNAIIFPEKLRLMPTESWTRYKYLFVRDLSPEQWDEISKFYDNCKNFDEAVELKDSSFKFNAKEIRANIQRIVADYSKELADGIVLNPTNDVEIEKKNAALFDEKKQRKDAAVDGIIKHLVESYGPDKPFNDAAYYYNLLPRSVVNTPTGERLKKLANRRIEFLAPKK
jgi:hypothetical protein